MARKAEKIICNCCSKELRVSEFYKSNSKLNLVTGKLPICKSCLQDRYNELLTIYEGNSNDAWRHICFNLDIFYDENLYIECSSKDNFIGEYFRLLSTKDRKDKTSLNNTLKNGDVNDVTLGDGNIINEDIITRWGRNRKYEDYMLLEKRYKQKIEDYPSKKPAEKSILRSMCLLELDIEEARVSDKKSVPALEKTLSDKFKQLGINPSDDKMYDEQSMLMFGVIMGIIENDYPVMDKQGIYKDVDGMNWYWYRNLIVPTMKAWDMANGDYSLDDGIKNIEIKPEIKALMEDKGHGE